MKEAIYIRTSTTEQNPDNQLHDCITLSKGEYEIYKDQQSAWKDNKERFGFERLKKDIQNRNINVLIVWDLDRLYRNRLKLKDFLQFCKLYKCGLLSYRQSFLNNIIAMPEPFNDMMFDFMINWFGWLAEDESKKKSDRVKIAVRKKDGITLSYKGNKWGRKNVSSQKVNKILECLNRNPKPSMRIIAQEVNCSLGLVHKIITDFDSKNSSLNDSSLISQ